VQNGKSSTFTKKHIRNTHKRFVRKLIKRNYLEEKCVDCNNKVNLKEIKCSGVDVLQCFRIAQMISCFEKGNQWFL